MNIEIERKFLVKDQSWITNAVGIRYCQGYFGSNGSVATRIRIAGEKGFITIKSAVKGISRSEFEYEIPVSDAAIMLKTMCSKPLVEKTRYCVEYDNLIWEIDIFDGANSGLIMAEVELTSEKQQVNLPSWIEKEVTGKIRYYNSRLINHPYSKWNEAEKRGL